jgi:hypothetical protein
LFKFEEVLQFRWKLLYDLTTEGPNLVVHRARSLATQVPNS